MAYYDRDDWEPMERRRGTDRRAGWGLWGTRGRQVRRGSEGRRATDRWDPWGRQEPARYGPEFGGPGYGYESPRRRYVGYGEPYERFGEPGGPGLGPGRPARGYPPRRIHTYDLDYGGQTGGPVTDYSGRAGYPTPWDEFEIGQRGPYTPELPEEPRRRSRGGRIGGCSWEESRGRRGRRRGWGEGGP